MRMVACVRVKGEPYREGEAALGASVAQHTLLDSQVTRLAGDRANALCIG